MTTTKKKVHTASSNGRVDEILKKKGGINLDIGCGANHDPRMVGMDMQDLPGVDIIHDWNNYPWPLPDECAVWVQAIHVIEHVDPANGGFLRWMDEVWRIAKVGAQFRLIYPHFLSEGFGQDPTHCNPSNQSTLYYFCPDHFSGLWNFYRPKPWRIAKDHRGQEQLYWSRSANVEALMIKMSMEEQDRLLEEMKNG